MRISGEVFRIALRRPFRVAHGSSSFRETFIVRLEEDGLTGFGEGALVPYYPSRGENCLAWLDALGKFPSGASLAAEIASLPPAPPEAAAARVALEIALHDWWGQKLGQPLARLWQLDPSTAPPGAWTLSLAESEDELRAMFEEAASAGRNHFKMKAGSDPDWDVHCVRQLRARFPFAAIAVDANAGWPPAIAAETISRLADFSIALVEQPTRAAVEAWEELRARLALPAPPLIGDESIQHLSDLDRFAGLIDGVNIKLLKAGGLSGARTWAAAARARGLRIMIGVMVETGIGRTAAAQLAPLADWLDIDAAQSIPAEPRSGFSFRGDRLELSSGNGLGLREIAP